MQRDLLLSSRIRPSQFTLVRRAKRLPTIPHFEFPLHLQWAVTTLLLVILILLLERVEISSATATASLSLPWWAQEIEFGERIFARSGPPQRCSSCARSLIISVSYNLKRYTSKKRQ